MQDRVSDCIEPGCVLLVQLAFTVGTVITCMVQPGIWTNLTTDSCAWIPSPPFLQIALVTLLAVVMLVCCLMMSTWRAAATCMPQTPCAITAARSGMRAWSATHPIVTRVISLDTAAARSAGGPFWRVGPPQRWCVWVAIAESLSTCVCSMTLPPSLLL